MSALARPGSPPWSAAAGPDPALPDPAAPELAVPGLAELVTPSGATARMVAAGLDVVAAVPDYVRHKPGGTTIVAYRIVTGDGAGTRGYAHWCADPDRAEAIHHQAVNLRPTVTGLGHGATRLDPNTVLYGFPVDRGLRRLRWWVTPRKLKRSLEVLGRGRGGVSGRSRVDVLRYKPERRLVARVDLVTRDGVTTPLLVRSTAAPTAPHLPAVVRALGAGGIACPAPVARLEGGRVSVDRFVPGRTLDHAVRDGSADPFLLARSLADLHAVVPPPGTPRRHPSDDLARARSGLAGLAALRPSLAGPALALIRDLTDSAPDDPPPEGLRLVHGDLHPENVLVDDGPGRPGTLWFLDLERAAAGPPAIDLGALAAQAIGVEVRRPGWSPDSVDHAETVVERYRSGAGPGGGVDERHLGWHTAVALVDQAILAVRQFEPGWATSADLILKSAVQLTGGST